jgi:hypothetical protein
MVTLYFKTLDNQPIEDRNLIKDNAVGKFIIGDRIPFPDIDDSYKINKKLLTKWTEEGPTEEPVYSVIEDQQEIMHITPKYDYERNQFIDNIGDIILLSNQFKTKERIGVNSTIEEFVEKYSDFNIWYTYVSNMYVIETKQNKAQFILNEEDFIGKLNVTGDMTPLNLSDFKSNSKIIKIRIY